jgi:hypothetical protein
MKEKEEAEFHRKMKKFEGKYPIETDWGKIVITLDAIPNYAGGKGCPDEILVVKVKVPILGTDVELSTPVLIELEKIGYSGAKEDLNKFCERSIIGEQKSYLEIPMIVIGGDSYRKVKSEERQLTARFNITQVPKRMIK